MYYRYLLADIVKYIHILLLIFVVIGPFILHKSQLKYYIYLVLFIFLDWNDFDGQCILTRIEFWLRTHQWKQSSPIEGGPEFFRPLFTNLTGKEITTLEADRLNNFLFTLCLLIAFTRYTH